MTTDQTFTKQFLAAAGLGVVDKQHSDLENKQLYKSKDRSQIKSYANNRGTVSSFHILTAGKEENVIQRKYQIRENWAFKSLKQKIENHLRQKTL